MSVPDYSKLSNWIDSATERGAVAVITHKNGDMDTIGSALVIAKAIGPKARACGTNNHWYCFTDQNIGTAFYCRRKNQCFGFNSICRSLDSDLLIYNPDLGVRRNS